MRPFRFVHTADLHLDSPFEGIRELNPAIGEHLQEATFIAFDRIIELCLDENVDFLLVAGDVFDSEDRSLRAQLKFRDGLARLSEHGISSFVVYGNHDPLSGWSAKVPWPLNVHIFGGEQLEHIPFRIDEDEDDLIYIYGVSFHRKDITENLAAQFSKESKGVFHIGLLHCNVGADTGHEPYAPCTVDDLVKAGMDYWALGHVHSPGVLRDENPAVVYPGTSQGRSPRESGARGCYLVTVDDDRRIETELVELDEVRWYTGEVDISGMDQEGALLEALNQLCGQYKQKAGSRSLIFRVSLVGRGELYQTFKRPGFLTDLLQELNQQEEPKPPFMWVERIEDRTLPDVDKEEKREVDDFVGEFLRQGEQYRKNPQALSELYNVLTSLLESRQGREYLETEAQEKLLQWLEEAEAYGLDLLLKEDL